MKNTFAPEGHVFVDTAKYKRFLYGVRGVRGYKLRKCRLVNLKEKGIKWLMMPLLIPRNKKRGKIENELTKVKEVMEVQEVTSQEPVTAYSEQAISDMPPSWYGSAEDWEEAKLYGWTVEGYEEQVRASENESGPIQPGDQDYVDPYDRDNEAVLEMHEFRNDFVTEHGREPTSGDIQSAWLDK